MTPPQIKLIQAAPVASEPLTISAAAKRLDLGRAHVEKLHKANYLPELTVDSIRPIRLADFITSDGELPLIQTAPSVAASGWRKYFGDAPQLSNGDWLDAQRGDWTGVSASRVLAAGYALVGIGSVVTGVTKVVGIQESGDPTKVRFEMELLGRLTSDIHTGARYTSQSASVEDQAFVEQVLGKRYEPRAGGSVMWL